MERNSLPMKPHSLFLALTLLVSPIHAAPFDPDKLDLGIPPEMLHALIRSTAAKIEAERAETKGLAARVEELLAMPEPEKKDLSDDRVARLAEEMALASYTVSANASLSGITGFEFDSTKTGRVQLYRDLEKQQEQDAADVRRWLRMSQAAKGFDEKDKEAFCREKAIGAARALVSREPKNAEAHALLAYALDWQDDSAAETLESVQNALRIDSKQPLGQVVLLDRKINKAQEAAAFRRPTGLGEKSPGDVMRQLYDHPLSAEEVAAFSREADVLGKEAVQTLHNAAEQKEFAAFMMATQLMPTLRARLTEAAASQKRAPDISYEEFTGQTLRKNMLLFFELFQSTGHAAKAAQLAGEDAEAIGAVALLVFTSRFVTAMRQGREPAAEDLALVAAMQKMLVEIARADDSVRAARACEAVSAFGIMSVLAGRRPEHPELLLRAVQLDPFRHRNLSFLIGLSMTLKEKRYATAAAVVEMQLAVLPNPLTRRQAAAVAARLHDWDAALRHLDAADKEKPGDLGVLSQRIATLLRQSPSKATIKKTGLLYGDITPDTVLEKTGGMETDERKEFIHNHLLHLIIAQRSADAEMELKAAVEAGIFSEEEAKELRGFMR